jgi:hypothetical protein
MLLYIACQRIWWSSGLSILGDPRSAYSVCVTPPLQIQQSIRKCKGMNIVTVINEAQTYLESRLQLIVLYVEGAATAIFTPGATVHCAADGDCSLSS